jgi:hypothetical protein
MVESLQSTWSVTTSLATAGNFVQVFCPETLEAELFVDRGELHAPPGVAGSLRTIVSFENFVLKLECRVPVGAVDIKSGIWLCSPKDSVPLQIEGVESMGVIVYKVKPGETGDLSTAAQGAIIRSALVKSMPRDRWASGTKLRLVAAAQI